MQDFEAAGKKFRSGHIQIKILTHVSLIPTNYGLRQEFLMTEIEALVKEMQMGLSKPEFFMLNELPVENNYAGLTLAYKLYHFNEG